MGQETTPRQACFALVEGCDKSFAPGEKMGTLHLRNRKDVLKRRWKRCRVRK